MNITIYKVLKDLPAVEALLMQPHTVSFVQGDIFVDGEDTDLPDEIDITIMCDAITVDDAKISIMFPDGYIADYEIQSDCYHYINIL